MMYYYLDLPSTAYYLRIITKIKAVLKKQSGLIYFYAQASRQGSTRHRLHRKLDLCTCNSLKCRLNKSQLVFAQDNHPYSHPYTSSPSPLRMSQE